MIPNIHLHEQRFVSGPAAEIKSFSCFQGRPHQVLPTLSL